MGGRLLVIISLALLTWVLSVANALPIDADHPLHLIVIPTYLHITERIASPSCLVLYVARSAVEGRAPPLV